MDTQARDMTSGEGYMLEYVVTDSVGGLDR
jgi:hypothetical protein